MMQDFVEEFPQNGTADFSSAELTPEAPHLTSALAHSEIGAALLKHFSIYGDVFVSASEVKRGKTEKSIRGKE